jgi:hypothetical protein
MADYEELNTESSVNEGKSKKNKVIIIVALSFMVLFIGLFIFVSVVGGEESVPPEEFPFGTPTSLDAIPQETNVPIQPNTDVTEKPQDTDSMNPFGEISETDYENVLNDEAIRADGSSVIQYFFGAITQGQFERALEWVYKYPNSIYTASDLENVMLKLPNYPARTALTAITIKANSTALSTVNKTVQGSKIAITTRDWTVSYTLENGKTKDITVQLFLDDKTNRWYISPSKFGAENFNIKIPRDCELTFNGQVIDSKIYSNRDDTNKFSVYTFPFVAMRTVPVIVKSSFDPINADVTPSANTEVKVLGSMDDTLLDSATNYIGSMLQDVMYGIEHNNASGTSIIRGYIDNESPNITTIEALYTAAANKLNSTSNSYRNIIVAPSTVAVNVRNDCRIDSYNTLLLSLKITYTRDEIRASGQIVNASVTTRTEVSLTRDESNDTWHLWDINDTNLLKYW